MFALLITPRLDQMLTVSVKCLFLSDYVVRGEHKDKIFNSLNYLFNVSGFLVKTGYFNKRRSCSSDVWKHRLHQRRKILDTTSHRRLGKTMFQMTFRFKRHFVSNDVSFQMTFFSNDISFQTTFLKDVLFQKTF